MEWATIARCPSTTHMPCRAPTAADCASRRGVQGAGPRRGAPAGPPAGGARQQQRHPDQLVHGPGGAGNDGGQLARAPHAAGTGYRRGVLGRGAAAHGTSCVPLQHERRHPGPYVSPRRPFLRTLAPSGRGGGGPRSSRRRQRGWERWLPPFSSTWTSEPSHARVTGRPAWRRCAAAAAAAAARVLPAGMVRLATHFAAEVTVPSPRCAPPPPAGPARAADGARRRGLSA